MLPEIFKVLIITLSDRAFNGTYEDRSGPAAEELVKGFFDRMSWKCMTDRIILPDDAAMLQEKLVKAINDYDIIFTTGGTGIGPRDITIETVRPLLSKEIPGIMEYIRVKYGAAKPNALLSRGVAGVAGKSLIYTLPGSEKAVNEYMEEISRSLGHTLEMLYGIDSHRKH